MRRHIFIGDIHGCYDEICELLGRAGVAGGDIVVAVGDLTRKGPAPDRCVSMWEAEGYRSVLGNNDAALLALASDPRRRQLGTPPDQKMLARPDLLDAIRRWPLWLDIPELGVAVVHGGVLPNSRHFSPDLVPREAALELRHVRRAGDRWVMVSKGKERHGDPFWSEVWDGDRIVIYGHTPRPEPKIDRCAIGLDTGCVYGGRLTAAVFDGPGAWRLLDVPSRANDARQAG